MQLFHGGGALAAGLTLGTTYVLSVGPNTMMIIREGLVRGRVILVASLVFASYVALLLLSLGITDAVAGRSASMTIVLTVLGLAAMIWFAMLSVRAALDPSSHHVDSFRTREPLAACLKRVAFVVVVNPLLYVEFLLIPSGALGAFNEPSLRLKFILGLVVMAALNCYGYAIGGQACASLFRHQIARQTFDLACGCVLAGLAVTIGIDLVQSFRA